MSVLGEVPKLIVATGMNNGNVISEMNNPFQSTSAVNSYEDLITYCKSN